MTERRLGQRDFDRRDFHKLTAAALGGLAAGSVLGCGDNKPATPAATPPAATPPATTPAPTAVTAVEKHLCRGLNECKGKGKDGKNSCRGQGICATVMEHTCGGQNDCKGLGGCGETAGANECKEKGGCHVPLMESAWTKVRARKDAEWKEKKLEAGAAPPEAKKG